MLHLSREKHVSANYPNRGHCPSLREADDVSPRFIPHIRVIFPGTAAVIISSQHCKSSVGREGYFPPTQSRDGLPTLTLSQCWQWLFHTCLTCGLCECSFGHPFLHSDRRAGRGDWPRVSPTNNLLQKPEAVSYPAALLLEGGRWKLGAAVQLACRHNPVLWHK